MIFRIGLTLIPGVGDKLAKSLIAHCGSAEAVFSEKKQVLEKIPGIGAKSARGIAGQNVLQRAEEELKFIDRENLRALYFLDEDYPRRLKLCEDGPVMLYYKGNADLNKRQVIAVVGTRNATEYGRGFCANFIRDLKEFNPLMISGLAYGIDAAAHKESLQNGIPTVAVLGHGHDRIYPGTHRSLAEKMQENGGLLTEFLSGTNPDRENFPKRNRIVAGISDAVVVVEAAKKGGALITAEIANSYNRDVFAVPGRLGDTFSEGCNWLIRTNKAAMIESVQDLQYILGWEQQEAAAQNQQTELFPELEGLEKQIYEQLSDNGRRMELDRLCMQLSVPVGKVLPSLMAMELKNMVKCLPGRVYALQ